MSSDPPPVDPALRRALVARSHALEPRVRIGAKGLSEAVVEEARRALAGTDLVKLRLAGDRAERERTASELAARVGAAVVKHLGRNALLYRPDERATS